LRGMRRYVEIMSKYSSIDLESMLADNEELRTGREVEYKGV
jgi:hypothetical protein